MGRKVARNKLLNNKQIKFYCNLEWRSKSKRLREKASRILFHDDFLIYYYKCPMSYEEISELDQELCKYCSCTEYGYNINKPNPSSYSFGCEGCCCKEAYDYYLNNF